MTTAIVTNEHERSRVHQAVRGFFILTHVRDILILLFVQTIIQILCVFCVFAIQSANTYDKPMTKEASIIGCLLGTAVGDALGLACEGLSKQRQHAMFPNIERYHFFWGKGMVSDDTEHTCMVAQSLLVSAGDTENFVTSLAWRFRGWLLGLPAGVGFATLRAILKLWIGFSGRHSGVFSAGNGPAMRSALLGVCYGGSPEKLHELVRASTRMTHTDPKAEFGALSVAVAAFMASTSAGNAVSPHEYVRALQSNHHCHQQEFSELLGKTLESLTYGQTTEDFAKEIGCQNGVSGYMYHTLPIVLHAWLSHQHDFRAAVREVIRCGGDTDTTAAIVGAIIGAGVGKQGIPEEWLRDLWEWPRTVGWMERLGHRLAEAPAKDRPQTALSLPICGLLVRNLIFLVLVLGHGIRRGFPPYH